MIDAAWKFTAVSALAIIGVVLFAYRRRND